ncbi:MAG TPA: citrate/2-methylcitrate synthase [Acidimicrobiales bacterium]|nr:citrate/2-methylcitrate synthase [Acidimicrobiales bacterium]
MSRTVAEVMTAPAVTAVASEALGAAARRMEGAGIGSVVVIGENRPIGILTERDLLRAAAHGADPSLSTVGEWMTPDPECLEADAPIDEAWRQLGERGYRHIPVVVGDEFKGIVSMRDLVALAQLRPAGESAIVAPAGLKGVVVAETELGDVRGAEGFFHYRQYSAPELAATRSFESVWELFVDGDLPSERDDARFRDEIARYRAIPEAVTPMLTMVALSSEPMTALRTALSFVAGAERVRSTLGAPAADLRQDALRLAAVTPTIVAALHRVRSGLAPIAPDPQLGIARDYLRMVHGAEAPDAEVRALEQYLILALDHGFNASTFTARVVTSTGADMGSAVIAALGALSGALHGGAIHRALDTLDAIGSPEHARAWVRDAINRGETIMGFGHPVYRTADPRSTMLREVARSLGGARIELACAVEREVQRALEDLKPGRPLHTNIEWYAAVVLERCGLPRDLFTPTFAATRIVGWCAQAMEQAADNRIIRPSARYVGPLAPQAVPRG